MSEPTATLTLAQKVIACTAIGAVVLATSVGPMWWWALNGMSEDVALAWWFTAMTTMLAALVAVTFIVTEIETHENGRSDR